MSFPHGWAIDSLATLCYFRLMVPTPPLRKIIHVDMDMFYAAVEMRDRPELRGKPLVVGGRPDSRSVATTANYEARKFGIHSGMSCAQARRLCPQCLFIPPDFKKYRQVSEQIQAIFHDYTDLVESISLDEAYLDATGLERLFGHAKCLIRPRALPVTKKK